MLKGSNFNHLESFGPPHPSSPIYKTSWPLVRQLDSRSIGDFAVLLAPRLDRQGRRLEGKSCPWKRGHQVLRRGVREKRLYTEGKGE